MVCAVNTAMCQLVQNDFIWHLTNFAVRTNWSSRHDLFFSSWTYRRRSELVVIGTSRSSRGPWPVRSRGLMLWPPRRGHPLLQLQLLLLCSLSRVMEAERMFPHLCGMHSVCSVVTTPLSCIVAERLTRSFIYELWTYVTENGFEKSQF